jgi:tripartite-type tricarboxylate transporter receptor subunit TctC
VAFGFDFAGTSLPFIRSGRLKPLLVTGPKRVPALPDVPTAAEVGLKELEPIVTWAGFVAPKGTPKDIVAKLNAAFGKVLRMKDLERTFVESGTFTMPSSSEQFTAQLRRELPRWAELLKRTKIEVE